METKTLWMWLLAVACIVVTSTLNVSAERIPVRRDLDREGNNFNLYAYHKYTEDLQNPPISIGRCTGYLACVHYAGETLYIENDFDYIYRRLRFSRRFFVNDSERPPSFSIPFLRGERSLILPNYYGSETFLQLDFTPEALKQTVIVNQTGSYRWQTIIHGFGFAYNARTGAVSQGGDFLFYLREPEVYDKNGSMLDGDLFNWSVYVDTDSLNIDMIMDLNRGFRPFYIDPAFEFNSTSGIRDTYIQVNSSFSHSTDANLLVEAYGNFKPLESNSTELITFNITGVNNESHICNVTNATFTVRFVANALTQTKAGKMEFLPNLRNWSDNANWWNATQGCTTNDCAWNRSGAQGESSTPLYGDHNTSTQFDRSPIQVPNQLVYSWLGSSQTVTLFDGEPLFTQLVNEWVNESRDSRHNGMQIAGVYDAATGRTLKTIVKSANTANVLQRPELAFNCDYVERPVDVDCNCVNGVDCEIDSDWDCIDEDWNLCSGDLLILSGGSLNCTGCNINATHINVTPDANNPYRRGFKYTNVTGC